MQRSQLSLKGGPPTSTFSGAAPRGNFLSWPDYFCSVIHHSSWRCWSSKSLDTIRRTPEAWRSKQPEWHPTRPGVSKSAGPCRDFDTVPGAFTHAKAVRKNTLRFHYVAGCSPAAALPLQMLISYGEARSNLSVSPNLQTSGGSRRSSWFNAIVGPSPGWVDRRRRNNQTTLRPLRAPRKALGSLDRRRTTASALLHRR